MCVRLKLLAFDLDGVLVEISNSWEYLHRYFNSDQRRIREKYSRLYSEGRISYIEWIKADIRELLSNSPKKIYITDLYEAFSKVKINSELVDYIAKLKSKGFKIAIISGGIYILAEMVGRLINADYIYANKLIFNEKGELVPGGIVMVEPLGKDRVLRSILSKEGLSREQTLFVGDSEWDLPALKYAGYSIAYKCEKCFHYLINSGKDYSNTYFAKDAYNLISIIKKLISCHY